MSYGAAHAGMTVDQIKQRIRHKHKQATTTVAAFFTNDVPRRVARRFIVGMLISNTDPSPIDIAIFKEDVDGNNDNFIPSLVVGADGNWPENRWPIDIYNPLMVLQGGQNIQFDVLTSGKTAEVTIWWYDEDY